MATENWYPISAATHDLPASSDEWTLTAGANKNDACRPGGGRSGPATHDDATSYITEATSGEKQALNIDWPGPMGSLGSIFTGNVRGLQEVFGGSDAATISTVFCNAAGTNGGSSWSVFNAPDGSWGDDGPIDVSNAATYRPGGGSWGISDFVDDKTIFTRSYAIGLTDDALHVTSIWGSIEFAPPAGGFAFLLNLAGLGALPFVGAMDFGHFTRYLSWRRAHHPRHTIMTGDEVRRAWDEIKAYRHPRFFFPAVA